MKKILLLLITASWLHGYSQDDSTKRWHTIILPDSSRIQVGLTKASCKVNTTDRELAENLMVKYTDKIRFVNMEYKSGGKRYTIYFPIEIKDEVLEYILNLKQNEKTLH